MRTDKASDYLFAACGTIIDQATVYRNTNAASSSVWTPVLSESAMGRTGLAIAPSDQSVIYASAASIAEGDFQDGLHAVFRSASSGNAGTWRGHASLTKLNTLSNSIRVVASAPLTQANLASPDGVWQEMDGASLAYQADQKESAVPTKARRLRLDSAALTRVLSRAPMEFTVNLKESPAILALPMPDRSYARFHIEQSSVMEPAMAARFPEIKSYRGQGIDDPTATVRFAWSPRGFHALVLSSDQAVNILPQSPEDITSYASFTHQSLASISEGFQCSVTGIDQINSERSLASTPNIPVGPTLRTYRIAVAATWEFCNTLGGGTVVGSVAAINAFLNGINAIYERELSVHLNLVNATNIIYSADNNVCGNPANQPCAAANDPYTNGNVSALGSEVIRDLRDKVMSANYDIGHVLGITGGGGAGIGVMCSNTDFNGLGPVKGGGASGLGMPVGNSDSVSLWAHELGHQFGATHSFNCGARWPPTAYESGNGFTIMSGGIGCPDYIAFTKALRFHAASFAQISDYITNRDGADCAVKTNTGNNTPTVNAGPAYTIPKNTPFTLTATGGDPDVNDASNLTYVWEQFDAGGANFANPPYTDAGDPGTTTRPIFRPFSPTASPSRTFPSLTYILNNANTPPPAVNGLQTAENLPQIGRIINFRATIRDNRGGVNDSSVVLTVDGNSGPFLMTAPNTAVMWTGGTQQNVTWSVSNTNNAPISCANVKISLSTDGGLSFPTVLAASTPNNGSAAVTVPNGIVTSTARIKVEAIGNIFFDISDANFSIILGDGCPVISNLSPVIGNIGNSVTITGTNFTGANAVKFSNNVTASFTVANDTTLVATVPAGAISGPITISKTGCTAAQTAAFTINPISTTITVKSNADSGGSCPGPTCTLRQAIAIARPGDTIGFDLSTVVSPITLTSTLTINKSLTIQGPGANLLTVSGNRAVRVFLIVGGDVTLSGLMIADGQGQSGGGIRKEGTGTLTILNSTLSGNSASEGGGIYNFSTGTTTVSNSTLSGNSATDGGGILNIGAGTVNITTSLLSGNTVTSNGGGINNLGTGTVNVTSSTLSGNSARGNFRSLGGGIFNNSTGTVTITNSTLSGNSASGFQVVSGRGGGIFNNSTGTVTVTNSTLSGNTATSQGGGISFNSGTLNVKGSTLSGNSADFGGGLGIFNSTASLTNCTISGNSGSAWGAGILFYGDSGNRLLTLTNCTISDNISGGGSGVRTESLGTAAITTSLQNTLVANNIGPNFSKLVLGTGTATVTSLGHNLDSDGMSGFTNGVNGDLIGSSGAPLKTLLAPLGNYGGPTQTHALLPGSLAINAGDNTVTSAPLNLTTDQRSTARPQQGSVDIGAYESQGFTLVIAGGNNQSTPLNTTFANPLAVTVSGTFGEPVSGGLVTFTPPGSGASATITGSPATISASGQAGINVTANSITGAYTVTATTQGGDTINFQLTNLCPSLALLPNTLANGIANMTYNQNLSATPTGTTYSFAVSSGNLPPGLMLNSVSGAISGTPVQVGTFTFTVTVTGFGTCSGSRAYTLTINNPVPVLASLNPNAATAGGGALILAVTGTNFVNGSLVRWNGADRPTTFVSSTQLTASIPASDIANAGSANVTVFNPTPGGSVSDGLSFTINPQGYEADVAPRPNGDNSGAVTITDWVQIGRFVAGLDTTANGSEFQRADCAPRDTLGDGRLSISDWVQAGRYAAGIDPVVAAGGPTMPAAGTQLASTGKPSATGVKTGTANGTQRTMRLSPGIEAGKIAIELDALGDENALGWSLRFDPSQWRFVAANAGNDARSATLHVNARQAASGHIGLALALPAGQTLPVGARQIVVVSFAPVGTRHDSGVMAQFADYPVAREAVGVEANALPASFVIRAQISLRERERQRKDSGVKHSARRIR